MKFFRPAGCLMINILTRLVEFTDTLSSATFSSVWIVPLVKDSSMTALMIVFWTVWIFSSFAPSRSVPVRVSIDNGEVWVDFMIFEEVKSKTMVTFENFMLARFEISRGLDMSKWLITTTDCDVGIWDQLSDTLFTIFFLGTGLASFVISTGNIQLIDRFAKSHWWHGSISIFVETVTSIWPECTPEIIKLSVRHVRLSDQLACHLFQIFWSSRGMIRIKTTSFLSILDLFLGKGMTAVGKFLKTSHWKWKFMKNLTFITLLRKSSLAWEGVERAAIKYENLIFDR